MFSSGENFFLRKLTCFSNSKKKPFLPLFWGWSSKTTVACNDSCPNRNQCLFKLCLCSQKKKGCRDCWILLLLWCLLMLFLDSIASSKRAIIRRRGERWSFAQLFVWLYSNTHSLSHQTRLNQKRGTKEETTRDNARTNVGEQSCQSRLNWSLYDHTQTCTHTHTDIHAGGGKKFAV